MKNITGIIKGYVLKLNTPNHPSKWKREISLLGEFGHAILLFLPKGIPIPENSFDKQPFRVYFRMREWDAIVDVLRNESPVRFTYYPNFKAARIFTHLEGVGEGEFEKEMFEELVDD